MNYRSRIVAPCNCVYVCLLLTLTGCGGGSDLPELGHVDGVVKYKGAPLANARIDFHPAEGRMSTGFTDSDGHYELTYLDDVPGAKVGTHNVSILLESGSDADVPPDPSDAKPFVQLPPEYNTKTTLIREVTPGEQVIDFDLK